MNSMRGMAVPHQSAGRLAKWCSFCIAAASLVAVSSSEIVIANPWTPMTSAQPGAGRFIPTPMEVPGKDFSDVRDRDANGVFDPEQVVAWDGNPGINGVRDSFDYSGSRLAYPGADIDLPVDGIASGGDALFEALRADTAALLFSVENDPTILFERATSGISLPGPAFGVWATATDIDAMNPPLDTDGLEIWGGDHNDDSDRYSLAADPFVQFPTAARKVAIWEYDSAGNTSTPHTFTSDLASSIDLQFGGNGSGVYFGLLVEAMDVDAIMTFGPRVTFSIRPITVPGTPIDFDGGEIFEYDGPGIPTRFLNHGGHLWDTAFDVRGTFGVNHENIDALEAAQRFVPEPSSIALGMLGLLAGSRFVTRRWR